MGARDKFERRATVIEVALQLPAKLTPKAAIALGVLLNLVGFIWWEGPGASESLYEYVDKVGNLVRRDVLVSLFSIPGYLLFFGGVAALLGRRDSRLLGYLRLAIIVAGIATTVLRVLRVMVVLIATGPQNLDLSTFSTTAPTWLVDAWYPLLLRGLDAFVLGVGLCMVSLVALAVHDGRRDLDSAEASRFRDKPALAISLGGVLYLVGSSLFSFDAGRPTSLEHYLASVGNLVRRDALTTLLLTLPGYLLFLVGIAVLLRRRASQRRLLSGVSRAITVGAGVAAATDVVWVALTLVAVGTADLDAPGFMLTASDLLKNAWSLSFDVNGIAVVACIGLSILGLVVNALEEPTDVRRPE